jgi:hypothetical protein
VFEGQPLSNSDYSDLKAFLEESGFSEVCARTVPSRTGAVHRQGLRGRASGES